MDMTQGSIFRQLTGYAVPLVLGNLFQLAYNAAHGITPKQVVKNSVSLVAETIQRTNRYRVRQLNKAEITGQLKQ